jgi:hypothetical protein
MTIRTAFILLISAVAGGCTSTTYKDKTGDARVQNAFEQPFRDVSWMRENPPEILISAVADPYARSEATGCEDIVAEIEALDGVLGPDLDQVLDEGIGSDSDGNALLSGAIASLIGLPYRGVIRRISGAGKREDGLRTAILAGMVRRGFLKGLALGAACHGPQPPLLDEAARVQLRLDD